MLKIALIFDGYCISRQIKLCDAEVMGKKGRCMRWGQNTTRVGDLMRELKHYKHSFVSNYTFFLATSCPSFRLSLQFLFSHFSLLPSNFHPFLVIRQEILSGEGAEEIAPPPQITASFLEESAVFASELCSLTPPVLFFFKSHNFLHEVTFSISVCLSPLLALPLACFSVSVALWVPCSVMNEFHSSFFWGLCEKL